MGKRRASVGAAALVRRIGPAGREWLAQWNPKWGSFHLVGGHKRDSESFRDCCRREVMEELELSDAEFRVAEVPFAHLEYEAYSRSAGEMTDYVLELFDVELNAGAAEKVQTGPDNRWLREEEIIARACADGRPVSETTEKVLRMAGLLGPG
jgi:8-oxo-dGTP pyrophosphatase MutT (NUDIX family)